MKRFFFLLAVLLFARLSLGQEGSWTVSGGYSNVHFSHASPNFNYNKDGGYLDGDVNVLLPTAPRLLVGAGVGGSWHYEDDYFNGNNNFFFGPSSSVGLFNLEGRIGVPISSRSVRGLFVLPRLGAGLLINDYWIDTPFYTAYHSGAAFELRPALQVGYSWGFWSMGGEVSYMWAWGDFGNLGSQSQELRAGVFVRFRF